MGIANIINTSTSSGGGGGEIIRELVNSSDGQGLHFDGASSHISIANSASAEFGTSDFSIEFILNQTQASTDETYYFTAPYTGDNRMGFWYDKANTTLKIYFRATSNVHYAFGYDIAADFGSPTHFVVSADRSGNAVLYRNGTEVGSVDISGSSAVNIGNSNANPFYISANAASTAIIGSLYRFRTFSKALSHDEVNTCFQRADVKNALKTNLLIDLDLAFSNPTQSLMIQNRAGAPDGTASSGVSQTQPIVQLNSTSARIGSNGGPETPADGELIASKVNVTTSGNGEVVVSRDSGAAALLQTQSAAVKFGATSNHKLQLMTNNTVRAEIDAAGLVSINKNADGALGPELRLVNDPGGSTAAGTEARLTFAPHHSGTEVASIRGIAENTGAKTKLSFYTHSGSALAERMKIDGDGVINIPNLSASSDVQTDGSSNLITSSDKRLKNDIGELTAGLDIINNLQPHYFSWKSDESNTQQLGFYAQDVYEFLPEAAPREEVINEDGSTDYKWGFNGRPIIAALVAAVKELKTEIDALKNA